MELECFVVYFFPRFLRVFYSSDSSTCLGVQNLKESEKKKISGITISLFFF